MRSRLNYIRRQLIRGESINPKLRSLRQEIPCPQVIGLIVFRSWGRETWPDNGLHRRGMLVQSHPGHEVLIAISQVTETPNVHSDRKENCTGSHNHQNTIAKSRLSLRDQPFLNDCEPTVDQQKSRVYRVPGSGTAADSVIESKTCNQNCS